MLFEIKPADRDILNQAYKDTTANEKKVILKAMLKQDFKNKSSEYVIALFSKLFFSGKEKSAAFLLKYIDDNKLVDKAQAECQIKSTKFDSPPENFKDNVKGMKLIVDWSNVKINDEIYSAYCKQKKLFAGISKTIVYIKDEIDSPVYGIKSLDYWYKQQ